MPKRKLGQILYEETVNEKKPKIFTLVSGNATSGYIEYNIYKELLEKKSKFFEDYFKVNNGANKYILPDDIFTNDKVVQYLLKVLFEIDIDEISFEECLELIKYCKYLIITDDFNINNITTTNHLFSFVADKTNRDYHSNYIRGSYITFLDERSGISYPYTDPIVKKIIVNYCKEYDVECDYYYPGIFFDGDDEIDSININMSCGGRYLFRGTFTNGNQIDVTKFLNNYIIRKQLDSIKKYD